METVTRQDITDKCDEHIMQECKIAPKFNPEALESAHAHNNFTNALQPIPENPLQKKFLSHAHEAFNLSSNPKLNSNKFHFSKEKVEKPKHCYDLPMLVPIENYIQHLRGSNSPNALNSDLAQIFEHLVTACRETVSKTQANSEVTQELMRADRNDTDEHINILEDREHHNANCIRSHARELQGIYQRLNMSDDDIRNWRDLLKSQDIEQHHYVDILYRLDRGEAD